MSARRVLFVMPSFHPAVRYGGPTSASWLLARSLGEAGLEVRVLTTDAHGDETLAVPRGEHERAPGVRVTYLSRRAWLGETAAPSLALALSSRVRWADVVHLGAVYSATTFPTLLACRAHRRPLVWTPFGAHYYAERAPDVRRPRAKALWDAIARRVLDPHRTVLVAESELEAEACLERMRGIEVRVVREPVELPEQWSHRPGSGALRLLFLGRLDPMKGLERLLDALVASGRDSALTVAGSGPRGYVESLRARARQAGSRVRFVGHADDRARAELFATHELLVVPSVRESYGIVVAEALAHGLPALVTRPTAWERLEPAGAGLVVGPEELSLAIGRLERASLLSMRARARALAERELRPEPAAAAVRRIYDRLVARGATARIG